jgi:sugar lactone lactonase YvrE
MATRDANEADGVTGLDETITLPRISLWPKNPAIPDLGALPSQSSALAMVALKPSGAVSCSAQRSNTFGSQRWVDYVARFTLRNSDARRGWPVPFALTCGVAKPAISQPDGGIQMNARRHIAVSVLVSAQVATASLSKAETFSTLITTPLAIKGLTSDVGNLYVPGRTPGPGLPCPVWRVNIARPSLVLVGNVPAPSASGQCSPNDLAFDRFGKLYVSQTDSIYSFFPNSSSPPTGTLFASGVPGTNGVAFDRDGNLWTGDGTTGQGRVWKINPTGFVTEMFRVQPMSNEVNLVEGVGGVGRDVRTLPPGTITVTATSRNAENTLGSQPLVANGMQFTSRGDLLIADTARGALWSVEVRNGQVLSRTGCDTTFTADTLCLDNIFVQHPYLEGIDGFVLDEDDNVWADANERQAVIFVRNGQVTEVFRNDPDPTTLLRNLGPLQTPTVPVLAGHVLCTANSDANRRDNSPNNVGEINPDGPVLGKISCMDQPVKIRGATLPVR